MNTVIIYQGPGSGKREAWWDEYVVTVTNRGGQALPLTDASLHSHTGETVQGSLVFRLTPSPRELALQCREGGPARDVSIPLTHLASLHLRLPVMPPATPEPGT